MNEAIIFSDCKTVQLTVKMQRRIKEAEGCFSLHESKKNLL